MGDIKKTSCYLFYLIIGIQLFSLYSCHPRDDVQLEPKQFTPAEKKQIVDILNQIKDSVIAPNNPEYQKEVYIDYPVQTKSLLQSSILKEHLPLRPDSAFYQGVKDATKNILKGNYVRKVSGLGIMINRVEFGPVWDSVLYYKYALKTKYAAGCQVDICLHAYLEGYNEIIYRAFFRFYGFDIFEKSRKEAEDAIEKYY
jgi:hypothetical protein